MTGPMAAVYSPQWWGLEGCRGGTGQGSRSRAAPTTGTGSMGHAPAVAPPLPAHKGRDIATSPVVLPLSTAAYLSVLSLALDHVLIPGHTSSGLQLRAHPSVWLEIVVIAVAAVVSTRLRPTVDTAARLLLTAVLYTAVLPAPLIALHFPSHDWRLLVLIFAAALVIVEVSRLLPTGAAQVGPPQTWRTTFDLPVALVLLALCLAFAVYMLATMGRHMTLVSYDDIYKVREVANTYAPRGYGYVAGAFAGAIGPLTLAVGLYWRKWWLILSSLVGFALIYLAAGNRSAFITIAAVLALAVFARRPRLTAVIPVLLAIGIVAARLLDSVMSKPYASALFTDRMLATPGTLDAAYFDFYSSADQLHWQYGFLRFMADHPVEKPALVIGRTYFREGNNANANFVADGYANFGYLGTALLLAAIIAVAVAIHLAGYGLPTAITIPSIATLVILFANTSPLTAMLNGGGGLLLLLTAAVAYRVRRSGADALDPADERLAGGAKAQDA
jgi:O-antigen polymerase